MDWRRLMDQLGVAVPIPQNLQLLLLAAFIIAIAFGVGALVGRWLAMPLCNLSRKWMGERAQWSSRDIGALFRWGLAALILLVAIGATSLTPLGQLAVAVALALAASALAYRLLHMAGVKSVQLMVAAALVFGLVAVAALGGMEPLMQQLRDIGLSVGSHEITLLGVVNFILVAAVLFLAIRLANRILGHSIANVRGFDPSQRLLMQKLASIAVVVVAFLIGIDLLGIDLTALAVFSGALGLAVGFGLQKTLGNLLAGLILLMDRSIKPGDVIAVGDTFGTVNKIGVRAVSVITRDGKEHLIPNEQLMTEAVENWSYSSKDVRIHVPVHIAYTSDLDRAEALMVEAATQSPRVLKSPKPLVWIKNFGDSAVEYDIRVWITDPEAGVGNVRADILKRLWVLFKENGVQIPFPQRDVHIQSLPPALLRRLAGEPPEEQGA